MQEVAEEFTYLFQILYRKNVSNIVYCGCCLCAESRQHLFYETSIFVLFQVFVHEFQLYLLKAVSNCFAVSTLTLLFGCW